MTTINLSYIPDSWYDAVDRDLRQPIVFVADAHTDWQFYRKHLRALKSAQLDDMNVVLVYLQGRVAELNAAQAAHPEWNLFLASKMVANFVRFARQRYDEISAKYLYEFVHDDWWLPVPTCSTCNGKGFVTIVTERESSFDYSVGQDHESVVCPACGLGEQ